MEITAITNHFVLVVILACLIVGYIIKHANFCKRISNNDIPCILIIFGALLNLLVSGLSIDSAVYGAVMGLASTGCHQAFVQWIEKYGLQDMISFTNTKDKKG